VTDRDGLRFAVLGTVRAWRGTQELPVGPAQRRAVLAMLLLRRWQPLTAAELVDGLWGAAAPPRAIGALRTHVAALRGVLEPDRSARAPARILVSVGDGYALRVPAAAVDLAVVSEQIDEARERRNAGDLTGARELLAGCLWRWQGEALAGVSGPFLDAQRVQLAERRLDALETFLETRLEVEHDPQLIPDLVALTAEHPLRERARVLLMSALDSAGRHADALKVYVEIRELLADRLGLDPGPELVALHQRIRGDAAVGPAAVVARPPAQLPADPVDFTGRAEPADRLVEQLLTPQQTVAICPISGMPGVGKSTLAIHVAHRLAAHFPDGQLYADLRGLADRPASPGLVLGAFLRAIGHAETDIPSTVDDRAGLFRTSLAGKRMLVVLDDARDAEQVRPLLPGTPGSAVLVTGRVILAGLPATTTAQLDVFGYADALALFTGIVGARRVRAEPAATARIINACAGLPLALRIAGNRLAARPNWSIAALAARLADERGRLAELGTAELTVADTFLPSYRALDAEQKRALRLLARADLPDLPVALAASIMDRTPDRAERLCESLVDSGLLSSPEPGRYGCHELLRLFGRALPVPVPPTSSASPRSPEAADRRREPRRSSPP
jgi:DNA-binding SARP family transcriptional activator